MIVTNHIWTENPIYCHKLRKVLIADLNHLRSECQQCPFYRGSAQGEGVENAYYDGTDEPLVQNPDPQALMHAMLSIPDDAIQQAEAEAIARAKALEAAKSAGG